MAQKPMLRGEVGARALRVRSDVRGHGQVRLCKALDCGRCGCLKPIRACCVVGSAFYVKLRSNWITTKCEIAAQKSSSNDRKARYRS